MPDYLIELLAKLFDAFLNDAGTTQDHKDRVQRANLCGAGYGIPAGPFSTI